MTAEIRATNDAATAARAAVGANARTAILMLVPILALPLPVLRGAATVNAPFGSDLAACLLALLGGVALMNRATRAGGRVLLVYACAFLVMAAESVVATVAGIADPAGGGPVRDWMRPGALIGQGLLPGLLLLLAPSARRLGDESAAAGDGRVVFVVMVLTAALTALSAMLPLPLSLPPHPAVGHPLDLLAGALFLAALLVITGELARQPDRATAWVALSAAVLGVGHLLRGFAGVSSDALGDMADLYQLVALALPVLGFALEPVGEG